MQWRKQQTLNKPVELAGVGFLTGADVQLRLLPAEENTGVVFQRLDLNERPLVAADIAHVVSCQRRTELEQNGVKVMLVEHVLAALAGLQVDNCVVQLNAPEPPGFDGSALPVAEAVWNAGLCEQNAHKPVLMVDTTVKVTEGSGAFVTVAPLKTSQSADGEQREVQTNEEEPHRAGNAAEKNLPSASAAGPTSSGQALLKVGYELDYGPQAPIPPQQFQTTLTPEVFLKEIAFARTFVLESEVQFLKAQGIGLRLTAKDLLVFGSDGRIIDNQLRAPDECARHKVLDCIGDLALLGSDLAAEVVGHRSGHQLNHELARKLQELQTSRQTERTQEAA